MMKIALPRLLALVTEHQQLGAESNTAVHRHRAAGHPTRLIGRKKQHRPDEIVGLSEPPERDHRLCRTPCFGVGIARARKPGQRWAGRDRVDPDAVRRQIDCHRMRQRACAALRGDIGGALGPRDLGMLPPPCFAICRAVACPR